MRGARRVRQKRKLQKKKNGGDRRGIYSHSNLSVHRVWPRGVKGPADGEDGDTTEAADTWKARVVWKKRLQFVKWMIRCVCLLKKRNDSRVRRCQSVSPVEQLGKCAFVNAFSLIHGSLKLVRICPGMIHGSGISRSVKPNSWEMCFL